MRQRPTPTPEFSAWGPIEGPQCGWKNCLGRGGGGVLGADLTLSGLLTLPSMPLFTPGMAYLVSIIGATDTGVSEKGRGPSP